MQTRVLIWEKTFVVVLSIVLALGVWGCGPSQDEVERIVAYAVQSERNRIAEEAVAQTKAYVDAKMLDESNYVDTKAVEVKNYVDNRAVQFENYADNRAVQFETYVDNAIREHRLYTDNKALEVQGIVDSAGQDFTALSEDTVVRVQDLVSTMVDSLCESDYWTTAAWAALLTLGDRELTPDTWFELGILIDDNYVVRNRAVCDVDANGRWYLIPQTDEVDEFRFE